MGKYNLIILYYFSIFLCINCNCSIFKKRPNNNLSFDKMTKIQVKQRVLDAILYISTKNERNKLKQLDTYNELYEFLKIFWKEKDPTPKTLTNEFKIEHLRRLKFTNQYYNEPHREGWETDRGRVYILYGTPDEIESSPVMSSIERAKKAIYGIEIWKYNYPESHHIQTGMLDKIHKNGQKFIFANINGLGNYEQIFSSEINEKVDPKIFFYEFENEF